MRKKNANEDFAIDVFAKQDIAIDIFTNEDFNRIERMKILGSMFLQMKIATKFSE